MKCEKMTVQCERCERVVGEYRSEDCAPCVAIRDEGGVQLESHPLCERCMDCLRVWLAGYPMPAQA